MKNFTRLAIILILSTLGRNKLYAQTCPSLVWSDEFDGNSLNSSNWNIATGNGCPSLCGYGNNELQSYESANLSVSNGTLKILAKQENIGGANYSSGKITSRDLQQFTYGRYEARIKLPKGDGLWPAFWMLSNNEPYGTWPKSGEIDIMEYIATNNNQTLGYIHYGDFWPNNKNQGKKYTVSNTNLSDDFHVFAIEWETNIIRWYIDGVLFSTKTNLDIAPSAWPFDHNFYFILNVAVGGNLGGAVNNSMLPATMEVDYVRVYGGNKPYLTGDNVVSNAATGKVYSLSQTAPGATINWTVPSGATIVSGQGTTSITTDFGTTNGNVVAQYTDNCNTNYLLTMPIAIQDAITKCATFENFDEAGSVTTNALTTGTLTEVANPLPADPINNSALVGKYDRNGGEQYDVLFYDVTSVANANEYKDGTKKFYMDVYTSAPVGTEIYLQLETAASAPSNYPAGRHSRYIATVQQNASWHRLEFSLLDQPDAGASPTGITKMVILFKPNSFTNDTYYFDNLDSYCSAVVPPALVKCSSFENFDEAGTVTKNTLTTGTLTEVANPLAADPINNSALVGKYDRNGGEQYDVLFYDVTSVANANEYKDGTKKFYMDVYTSAPVGTEIYLQLETAASAPSNYPAGRHSRYIATVQQNASWHRLEFSLLDQPDAGASPTGITKMVILFKPNSFTNDTYYFDNLDSYCSAVVPPALVKCSSFENFDEAGTVTKNILTTGTLTEVANPLAADPINNSALVGKYDRNGGEQYDVLFYDVTSVANANEYKDGTKKFYMDVYTSAPVGTEIYLQLETASSAPANYPTGRHSRYIATVQQNASWHRLEFSLLDQPDAGASPTGITKMVILFKPNSFTNDTYYFDNLDSYCSAVVPPTLVKCSTLENFDDIRAIAKNSLTSGTLTDVANPLPADPINNTAKVGKYDRNGGAQYDVLFYDINTITDATLFKNGTKKFYMDVYTTAPIGTEIILQLETSVSTPGNYPVGRHSRYNAFTTDNTKWQRLEFTFVDQPDGGSVATDIKTMVLLFNPNSFTNNTYYFDNLDIYCNSVTPPTTSLAKCSTFENFDDPAIITVKPLTTGNLTEVANPLSSDALNSTALVGKYIRDGAAAYDVLFYDVTSITNATDYKDGLKKFFMDVYSTAAIGTEIILQLESSAATGGNYPTGRHSRYHAFITDNANWHRLEFSYIDQPDPSTSATDINTMVLLFKPGTNTNDTYYFDNLDTYCVEPASLSTISGVVYQDNDGGIIDGTPLTVGGTYMSIFNIANTTSTPNYTVPVAANTGEFTFPALPTGTYKLIITTNPAGANVPSYPNIGGFSMKAGAEGQSGTTGDGTANGMTMVTVSNSATSYGSARVAAPTGVSFAIIQNAPLPVRLISFEGKAKENGNELIWKVTSEQNFSHYEIEKSNETRQFRKIGTVAGKTNSLELLAYTFLDKKDELTPKTNNQNGAYYRLKMVDIDGKAEYSKLLFIENKAEKSTVGNFYPNPSQGNDVNILINSMSTSNWTITAYDLSGSLISTETRILQKGENKVTFKKNSDRNKIAIYRFENADGIQYRKLIN